jgi:branched-subunit amino acid aminotransferase/4-amino-4-deoxychorismate lyase
MFLRNGELIDRTAAVFPVDSVEATYGFGVYESVRVRDRVAFFPADHAQRLLESAAIIGLAHQFSQKQVLDWIGRIVREHPDIAYNIKIILLGGPVPADAQMFLFTLRPRFLSAKEYAHGVDTITVPAQRLLPKAKTLNMLASYLAYRDAQRHDCFDALFVDHDGFVTEGTRTNLFALKGAALYGAPGKKILLGVTRKYVLEVAARNGFSYAERDLSVKDLLAMDAVFLTSTGAKIVPVRSIDGKKLAPVPSVLKKLMHAFDSFLDAHAEAQNKKKRPK